MDGQRIRVPCQMFSISQLFRFNAQIDCFQSSENILNPGVNPTKPIFLHKRIIYPFFLLFNFNISKQILLFPMLQTLRLHTKNWKTKKNNEEQSLVRSTPGVNPTKPSFTRKRIFIHFLPLHIIIVKQVPLFHVTFNLKSKNQKTSGNKVWQDWLLKLDLQNLYLSFETLVATCDFNMRLL